MNLKKKSKKIEFKKKTNAEQTFRIVKT